ncbi:hypothetical protein BESB_084370 [Besnoitia besnoiti]|uniref:BRCT domain-containing protein n=1 Tax=Besnoitia besnoiti TaxID=94643 RepID=A0A2A9M420_BESBE|nr:hypothetical protein BESB_084370 [Besnoitia besnoiti]PFH33238.1 hypothetical protein BESB_084370 [Besnoitia besnoiti]
MADSKLTPPLAAAVAQRMINVDQLSAFQDLEYAAVAKFLKVGGDSLAPAVREVKLQEFSGKDLLGLSPSEYASRLGLKSSAQRCLLQQLLDSVRGWNSSKASPPSSRANGSLAPASSSTESAPTRTLSSGRGFGSAQDAPANSSSLLTQKRPRVAGLRRGAAKVSPSESPPLGSAAPSAATRGGRHETKSDGEEGTHSSAAADGAENRGQGGRSEEKGAPAEAAAATRKRKAAENGKDSARDPVEEVETGCKKRTSANGQTGREPLDAEAEAENLPLARPDDITQKANAAKVRAGKGLLERLQGSKGGATGKNAVEKRIIYVCGERARPAKATKRCLTDEQPGATLAQNSAQGEGAAAEDRAPKKDQRGRAMAGKEAAKKAEKKKEEQTPDDAKKKAPLKATAVTEVGEPKRSNNTQCKAREGAPCRKAATASMLTPKRGDGPREQEKNRKQGAKEAAPQTTDAKKGTRAASASSSASPLKREREGDEGALAQERKKGKKQPDAATGAADRGATTRRLSGGGETKKAAAVEEEDAAKEPKQSRSSKPREKEVRRKPGPRRKSISTKRVSPATMDEQVKQAGHSCITQKQVVPIRFAEARQDDREKILSCSGQIKKTGEEDLAALCCRVCCTLADASLRFERNPKDLEAITHLIVPHDQERPTLKVLFVLATGGLVLNPQFVKTADENEKWPRATPRFEIYHFPTLLHRKAVAPPLKGKRVAVAGTFQRANAAKGGMTKALLCRLIELSGGVLLEPTDRVPSSPEFLVCPEDFRATPSEKKEKVKPGSGDEAGEDDSSLARVDVVTVQWVVESIRTWQTEPRDLHTHPHADAIRRVFGFSPVPPVDVKGEQDALKQEKGEADKAPAAKASRDVQDGERNLGASLATAAKVKNSAQRRNKKEGDLGKEEASNKATMEKTQGSAPFAETPNRASGGAAGERQQKGGSKKKVEATETATTAAPKGTAGRARHGKAKNVGEDGEQEREADAPRETKQGRSAKHSQAPKAAPAEQKEVQSRPPSRALSRKTALVSFNADKKRETNERKTKGNGDKAAKPGEQDGLKPSSSKKEKEDATRDESGEALSERAKQTVSGGRKTAGTVRTAQEKTAAEASTASREGKRTTKKTLPHQSGEAGIQERKPDNEEDVSMDDDEGEFDDDESEEGDSGDEEFADSGSEEDEEKSSEESVADSEEDAGEESESEEAHRTKDVSRAAAGVGRKEARAKERPAKAKRRAPAEKDDRSASGAGSQASGSSAKKPRGRPQTAPSAHQAKHETEADSTELEDAEQKREDSERLVGVAFSQEKQSHPVEEDHMLQSDAASARKQEREHEATREAEQEGSEGDEMEDQTNTTPSSRYAAEKGDVRANNAEGAQETQPKHRSTQLESGENETAEPRAAHAAEEERGQERLSADGRASQSGGSPRGEDAGHSPCHSENRGNEKGPGEENDTETAEQKEWLFEDDKDHVFMEEHGSDGSDEFDLGPSQLAHFHLPDFGSDDESDGEDDEEEWKDEEKEGTAEAEEEEEPGVEDAEVDVHRVSREEQNEEVATNLNEDDREDEETEACPPPSPRGSEACGTSARPFCESAATGGSRAHEGFDLSLPTQNSQRDRELTNVQFWTHASQDNDDPERLHL